jgi:glycosyltransferase involved in cell wall biosynthesis
MSSPRPSIGLVIPTWNRGPLIERAIESVVHQGFDEIVVADDGSTDDTAEIVGRHEGVTYVRQEHTGANAARNLGVRNIDADFVTFLDSDDVMLDDFVAAYRAALDSGADVVTSGFIEEQPDGRRRSIGPVDLGPVFHGQMGCFGHGGTYAVRRDLFWRVGGFDEAVPAAQHTEFAIRLLDSDPRPRVEVLTSAHCVYFASRLDGIRSDPVRVGRGAAALLDRHRSILARDPERLSDHAGVASRGALIEGDGRRARSFAFAAVRATPTRGRAWGRLALAMLPPAVRRRILDERAS